MWLLVSVNGLSNVYDLFYSDMFLQIKNNGCLPMIGQDLSQSNHAVILRAHIKQVSRGTCQAPAGWRVSRAPPK